MSFKFNTTELAYVHSTIRASDQLCGCLILVSALCHQLAAIPGYSNKVLSGVNSAFSFGLAALFSVVLSIFASEYQASPL